MAGFEKRLDALAFYKRYTVAGLRVGLGHVVFDARLNRGGKRVVAVEHNAHHASIDLKGRADRDGEIRSGNLRCDDLIAQKVLAGDEERVGHFVGSVSAGPSRPDNQTLRNLRMPCKRYLRNLRIIPKPWFARGYSASAAARPGHEPRAADRGLRFSGRPRLYGPGY